MKRYLLLSTLLLLQAGPAKAVTTIFTFGAGDDQLTTFTKVVNGITLTVDSFGPPDNKSTADADGFAVYSDGALFASYSTFNMTFSKSVKLIEYNVGFSQGSATTTYSQGILASVRPATGSTGAELFANQFTVTADVPLSVSTTGIVLNDLLQIKSLTVEEVSAPQPSGPSSVPTPLPISGGVMALSWSRRLRLRLRLRKRSPVR